MDDALFCFYSYYAKIAPKNRKNLSNAKIFYLINIYYDMIITKKCKNYIGYRRSCVSYK